jgi:hypothetical protein
MSKRLNRCLRMKTKGDSYISIAVTAARAAGDGDWRIGKERLIGACAPEGPIGVLTGSTKVVSMPAGWTEVVIPKGLEHVSGLWTAPGAVLVSTSGDPTAGGRIGFPHRKPEACLASSASFSCPSNHEVMI